MYTDASELPTVEDATNCMKELVLNYPRFGSIAVTKPKVEQSYFELVQRANLDWGYHVVRHECADEAAVRAKVQELVNIALDDSKPRWRFDLIANQGTGKAATLLRVDHCLADGLRLVKASGGFVKFEDGSPAELALLKKMSAKKTSAAGKRSIPELLKQFFQDLPLALTADQQKPEDASCYHVPKTIFDNEKRVLACSVVSLSDIKAIRTASPAGTTLNDVILAAFCGALDRYAAAEKTPLNAGSLMRSFCAVSMPDIKGRPKEDMYNNFLMASFELPVGHSTSAARLAAAKATMDKVKTSMVGIITDKLSHLLGRLGLDNLASDTQLKVFPLHSFVYSNVPGFEQPVYLFTNKSKITSFEVYYPNIIHQSLFLSYCDQLTFSLTTCPKIVKNPQALVQAFVDEVAQWKSELSQ